MARPSGKKPMIMGMGIWASRPAIRPIALRYDDGKPRNKQTGSPLFGRDLLQRFSKDGLAKAWGKASRLPSDLKWIAMVVPLILGIWVLARPTAAEPGGAPVAVRQEEPAAAVPAAAEEKPEERAAITPVPAPAMAKASKSGGNSQTQPAKTLAPAQQGAWDLFTARIASRASVDLVEDFRNGLSAWEGRGEWARSWSYDRTGTVRPGQMALFQPTVNLRDYVLEMKAAVERRSIQWVVRASNPQNYHFSRLNVTPGVPLTKLELERWTVVNGRMGRVTRLPLPHGGANQTLYSIRVEVKGDSVSTYLQDQVIDTFSDPRLQEGGIGLIGAGDDRPRIYGIHVYHQNDFLGKLCSFLAPQPINSQGSE